MNEANRERTKEILKRFFKSHNILLKDVVEKYNEKYGTDITIQSLSNKISRGTIPFYEVLNILDLFNYKVRFEEGAEFQVISLQSKNLGICFCFGSYVNESKDWFKLKTQNKTVSKIDEIMLMHQAAELFDVGFYADHGKLQIFASEEQKQRFEDGNFINFV